MMCLSPGDTHSIQRKRVQLQHIYLSPRQIAFIVTEVRQSTGKMLEMEILKSAYNVLLK